ncbi:MBL fold metallo-hydrolase [Halobacteriales archaeon QS_3_64_16]|nr:MAG: MBL fold metallo-hydrolase [Halobacteriales archaeon QS_3_64_16]
MHRIRLGNTVFEGLNDAYLLGADSDGGGGEKSDGPLTLVDTGVATPDTREELVAGLENAGVGVGEIEQVLLTHWHEDHAGLAGWIQKESDATVRAHTADAPLIEGDREAHEGMEDRQRERFEQWGMPAGPQEELLEFMSGFDDARGDPAEVSTFEDSDRFRAGEHDLEVLHLPGHARGLSGFAVAGTSGLEGDSTEEGVPGDGTSRGNAELFSGDALLPHYTPNVGGADVRVDRALEKYLETLSRIADQDFSIAWPGHRDPIAEPTDRAIEIATHHRERTENVLDVLREHGPADAWTVSEHLFGDLSAIHILHGPGEAFAHLDHLTGEAVEREPGDEDETGNERVQYRLLEGDPDLDRLFPEIALAET